MLIADDAVAQQRGRRGQVGSKALLSLLLLVTARRGRRQAIRRAPNRLLFCPFALPLLGAQAPAPLEAHTLPVAGN
jgi:hypothetical protein